MDGWYILIFATRDPHVTCAVIDSIKGPAHDAIA